MKWRESWELDSIPEDPLWAEVGRRRRSKSEGKPKKLRRCEFCGLEFGAREMLHHLPRCLKRPNARKAPL
jgi:hypothetical protein